MFGGNVVFVDVIENQRKIGPLLKKARKCTTVCATAKESARNFKTIWKNSVKTSKVGAILCFPVFVFGCFWVLMFLCARLGGGANFFVNTV
jgi:hypothetical protein